MFNCIIIIIFIIVNRGHAECCMFQNNRLINTSVKCLKV